MDTSKIKSMNGKLLVANSKNLYVQWNGGHVKVTDLAAPTNPLFDNLLFTDVEDFEDITIDDAGNATFVVRTSSTAVTSSDKTKANMMPKLRYPYFTVTENLQVRAIATFVNLS